MKAKLFVCSFACWAFSVELIYGFIGFPSRWSNTTRNYEPLESEKLLVWKLLTFRSGRLGGRWLMPPAKQDVKQTQVPGTSFISKEINLTREILAKLSASRMKAYAKTSRAFFAREHVTEQRWDEKTLSFLMNIHYHKFMYATKASEGKVRAGDTPPCRKGN